MSHHEKGWDGIYHRYAPESLPWELGKPRKILVELIQSKTILPGKVLDPCCGAGTNPIYLAQNGFDVTALDVSHKAVELTKENVHVAQVDINLLVNDYLQLPFRDDVFDFVFDFGCFHHVGIRDRFTFIDSISRVIKPEGNYLLVCFSDKNGYAWNHFSENQIIDLFRNHFRILWIKHSSSLEADNVTRHFYETYMEKNVE